MCIARRCPSPTTSCDHWVDAYILHACAGQSARPYRQLHQHDQGSGCNTHLLCDEPHQVVGQLGVDQLATQLKHLTQRSNATAFEQALASIYHARAPWHWQPELMEQWTLAIKSRLPMSQIVHTPQLHAAQPHQAHHVPTSAMTVMNQVVLGA